MDWSDGVEEQSEPVFTDHVDTADVSISGNFFLSNCKDHELA